MHRYNSKAPMILPVFSVCSLFFSILFFSSPLWRAFGPVLLINKTDSLPHGIYFIELRSPHLGEIAAFRPPNAVKKIYANRPWFNAAAIFLKPINVKSGTRLCWRRQKLTIGRQRIKLSQSDSAGEALMHPLGCITLQSSEVFPLSFRTARSFDARYFGPIPVRSIIGTAHPLLTW